MGSPGSRGILFVIRVSAVKASRGMVWASINQKTLKKQAKNMQNEQRFVGEKQQTEKQSNGEKTVREFV